MMIFEAILLTIITAATPLLLAAIGEVVVERSGVLNLGVEGMMIMGAATGFAVAILTGSSLLGVMAGLFAGMAMSLLFAALVLGLAANQVASGLALTIFGLGLSGLVGFPFVGAKREAMAHLYLPYLSDLPFFGRVIFGQDPLVYIAFALALAVALIIGRTRAGLVLRAVGENHHSAHALGHNVRQVRLLAILFGGACAGLAGAYLSLVYTPFWTPGMTAGRGWIALAIVVFASWRAGRAVIGAYLFGGVSILQLHAQGFGLGVPAQALAALPYLTTIIVLFALSRLPRGSSRAPACLGQPFLPAR
ncbi:ABC transporter permease [Candidatus Raskinella chloraquaticus]|jgi:general nucleoside transport system permease protein|uniref:ABC transporter permease n=1 Tax=Candidatus Raskinella chloraquaticus TaxID=1951219 RepID=A0A1W9I5P0_9HYPH|nr:MAG: ABC transporter permease [Proteobacteria bacterium SG_bin8]